MLIEKGTMTTEAVYNETKTERYRLTKIWDSSRDIYSLLMIQAGTANEVTIGMTEMYCIRNLHQLGAGGFDALNISSVIAESLDPKTLTLNATNVKEILASINRTGKCIICWGKIGESNSKVAAVQRELLKQLEPVKDKLYTIVTDEGACWHPIAPQIRHEWIIDNFVLPGYLKDEPKTTPESPAPTATSEQAEQPAEQPTKQKRTRRVLRTA